MKAKKNFKVDVAPEMELYKILQRQSYSIETALAEFVDNSVQSFKDQRNAIKDSEEAEPKLRVRIAISSLENRIAIEDNAGGINRENFQRAIRMGYGQEPRPKTKNLSVYGIGMKSSAIWFSNRWTIETSALGSGEKLTTTFDLEQLLASGTTKIEVRTSPEDEKKHYTKITIIDCLRELADPNKQFEETVLPYLQETFYKFTNVFIEIMHDGLVLQTTKAQLNEPLTLIYPRVDKNGEMLSNTPVEWKKKLDFTYDNKPVRGFILIREKGSYHGPGIRLLRNQRVIYGTKGGNRQNKPQVLLGTSNKYASQRIYGEIHLDDFPVNFMKTGFDINMYSLYRAIKTEISARLPDIVEDFVDQATYFRKNKKTSNTKTESKTSVRNKSETEIESIQVPDASKQIRFSSELNNALEQLSIKKLYRLYSSLCRVSLINDPVLAYVGAWTLLESLATQMGKKREIAFKGFFNSHFKDFVASKAQSSDCQSVIADIHAKGNMNKHSGVYEAMNAQQLVSDFQTIEQFLIHCAEKITKATP